MSTFYGGEQLAEVKNESSSSTTAGVKYTVPAGRYAKVFVKEFNTNGGLPTINVAYSGGASRDVTNAEVVTSDEQFELDLYAGDAISVDGGLPITYSFLVLEYLIP